MGWTPHLYKERVPTDDSDVHVEMGCPAQGLPSREKDEPADSLQGRVLALLDAAWEKDVDPDRLIRELRQMLSVVWKKYKELEVDKAECDQKLQTIMGVVGSKPSAGEAMPALRPAVSRAPVPSAVRRSSSVPCHFAPVIPPGAAGSIWTPTESERRQSGALTLPPEGIVEETPGPDFWNQDFRVQVKHGGKPARPPEHSGCSAVFWRDSLHGPACALDLGLSELGVTVDQD